MSWQPIETAPKDGTEFDGWNGERITNVSWSRPLFEEDNAWCANNILLGGYAQVYHLTHWMLLPQPPEQIK